MLHGPHTDKSPCIIKNKTICNKKFPKEFCDTTIFKENGYPEYQRRNNILENHTYRIKKFKKIIPVDNSMVVPYNNFLLKKYKCHINVEYCASIHSIKYIFDYIHKGGDRALCKIKKIDNSNDSNETPIIHDEITQYVDGRYLSPMEAAWRLQGYPFCGKIPAVERLGIHTKDQQNIVYEENKELQALSNKETTLTAWFKLNKIDNFAKTLRYVQLPEYYRFDKKSKSWIKRSRSSQYNTIARLNIVSPKDTERFFLKLIINRARGPTSFEDLKKHKDITYQTYKDAALAMGLIEDDSHIFIIFEEACHIMLPFQLRKFFAWFILAENIQGNTIWNKFKNYFTEDFNTNKENNALSHIQIILENEEKSCKDFSLPEPNSIINDDATSTDNVSRSADIFQCMLDQLTKDQKSIFEELVANEHKIYFIDGPGGSGKTFLYKALIYYYMSLNKKVLSMAWTGIASILLPKGLTSHRTFRLPLDLSSIESAFLKLESDKKRLREADLIIWDEASMIPKKALEIINRTLQDVCRNDIPFGGKLIVLGGDFRQILPVIKHGYRNSIIEETIKYSTLWPLFKILKLNKNIRSKNVEFSSLLLEIGEGKVDTFEIPQKWKTTDVCNEIYKNINLRASINTVILAPHNEDIKVLNDKVIKLLHGESKTYYSVDYATHKGVDQTDENIHLNYPVEMLNEIREGLPPHKLNLKVNAIVMLIRNLSITDGLCNGTRLKITKLYEYNIEAEIITGENIGQKVFIPRITLNTENSSSFPFTLFRKQFPIILAFAITINKSQGQSFDSIGIFLRRPLFSHGQLYVALSRCRNPNNIYIQNESGESIDNIVWNEILNS